MNIPTTASAIGCVVSSIQVDTFTFILPATGFYEGKSEAERTVDMYHDAQKLTPSEGKIFPCGDVTRRFSVETNPRTGKLHYVETISQHAPPVRPAFLK